MNKWHNLCARIDIPQDLLDDFVDALMDPYYELGVTAELVGTLSRVEVTVNSLRVSQNKLRGFIETALEKIESRMENEFDAAFVTYWDEYGYAPK